jgi:hypothetical protein
VAGALFRLTGTGDRASGGDIPLPDALIAVVEELLDHGSAHSEKLNELVYSALSYKEARILSAAWRTWQDFTLDILERLTDIDVVAVTPYGRYVISTTFVPGRKYEFIPGITFTVRDKKTREEWDDNSAALLKIRPVLYDIRDKLSHVDPHALKHIMDAESILRDRLEMQKEEERQYQSEPERKRGAVRNAVRRGDSEWRALTKEDMPSPVKSLSEVYVISLPKGKEFSLSSVVDYVNDRIREIEKDIPELIGLPPAGGSTIAQAIQGKDQHGGLIAGGYVEKLPRAAGRPNITYRRLLSCSHGPVLSR